MTAKRKPPAKKKPVTKVRKLVPAVAAGRGTREVAKVKSKPKGGRPGILYLKQFADQAELLCRKHHYSDADLAHFFGISPRTLVNWKLRHPEFLRSTTRTRDELDDLVEVKLRDRALGYSHEVEKLIVVGGELRRETVVEHVAPDVAAQRFYLMNRRSINWRKNGNEGLDPDKGEGGPVIDVSSKADIARRVAFMLAAGVQSQQSSPGQQEDSDDDRANGKINAGAE